MDIYQALAEPNRRTILEMLAEHGELSATDISDKFSISSPAISQHLKILKLANIVTMEKRAQQRIYQLNPDSIKEVEDWVQQLTKTWNERFGRLDTLLERLKKGSK